MKQAFALLLALCLLLSLAACGQKDEESESESKKFFVLTQVAKFDSDGICVSRDEFSYDDAAQVVACAGYRVEMKEVYDPEWDIKYYTYDADSPLVLEAEATLEYDEYGNITACKDPKMYWYPGLNDYIWQYADGKPESFEMAIGGTGIGYPTPFSYDEDGNITMIAGESKMGGHLYIYDEKGRLTQEFTKSKTGEACEFTYTYDSGKLSRVQLRSGYGTYPIDDPQWDDVLSVRWVREFAYDDDRLHEIRGYDEQNQLQFVREYSYDKKGHPTKMECTTYTDSEEITEVVRYTCDQHGNIIKVEYDTGEWVEYTYQAMQVSKLQQTYYHRRRGLSQVSHRLEDLLFGMDWNMIYSHLIPNPLFDLLECELLK